MITITFRQPKAKSLSETMTTDKLEAVPALIGIGQVKYGSNVITKIKMDEPIGGWYGFNGDTYPITVHLIADNGKKIYYSSDDHRWNRETNQYEFSNNHMENTTEWRVAKLTKDGKYRFSKTWWMSFSGRAYTQNPHI